MFRALDYINYSSLKTNPDQRSSTAFSSTAAPLQYICCDVLCAEAPSRPEHLQWLHYAIHILPPHLLTNLLQVAVKESHRPVICRIIARWPLSTLWYVTSFCRPCLAQFYVMELWLKCDIICNWKHSLQRNICFFK